MNLLDRAKNILLTPKTEWLVIQAEFISVKDLLVSYVLPLSLIPAVVALLTSLIWTNITFGAISAVIAVVSAVVSFYVGTYITDALAPSFSSEKNVNRSAQLVGYSYTASAVASILAVIPIIGILAVIAGFGYTVYLMYLGTTPLKKTPEEKRVGFVIVIVLLQMAFYYILTSILSMALLPRFPFY